VSDELVLVCALVEDSPPTPGAVRNEYCTICADEIWMSPTAKQFSTDHPEAKVICVRCRFGLPDVTDEANVEALPGTTVSKTELQHLDRVLRRIYQPKQGEEGQ
jgi:hypothetical protein